MTEEPPHEGQSLEERKAQVGKVRPYHNYNPELLIGIFGADRFEELATDYGPRDADGRIRDWLQVIRITIREKNLSKTGLKPDLIHSQTVMEGLTDSLAQVAAQALEKGMEPYEVENAWFSLAGTTVGEIEVTPEFTATRDEFEAALEKYHQP